LYAVLRRIFRPRPQVLLETCSSGGNRFDLGMLTFGPQIWSSDDTDPIERLTIQQGLSYLYPQSAISAHVSASPNQQTLRVVPLSTRGNVASFGVLGYEMDLNALTDADRAEIREQTAFYKQYRHLLQVRYVHPPSGRPAATVPLAGPGRGHGNCRLFPAAYECGPRV
jgi:alpha-galactosidase